MGFGEGLQRPPRAGRVLGDGARAGWEARALALPRDIDRIVLLSPPETPPGYDRDMLGALGRLDEHARRLITPRPLGDDRLSTERPLLGDARDLLLRVLRRALADNLPGVDLAARGSAEELADPRILCVHVGATDFVRRVLADVRRGRGGWDGTPEALDADGFAWLCARRGEGALHLFFVGGSDYGTFFGVAAFLEEVLGVVWVSPGDAGEVIPPLGSIATTVALDRFEEPTVRSRTFALMSSRRSSAAEIDELRTWMLCNRLRPDLERSNLYRQTVAGRKGVPPEHFGPPPGSLAFHYAMLESEARFPAEHTMRKLLSPFTPPVLPEVGVPGSPMFEARYLSQRETWPELRARVPVVAPSPAFDAMRVGMVSSLVGSLVQSPSYTWLALDCTGAAGQCPEFQPFDHYRGRLLATRWTRLSVNEVARGDARGTPPSTTELRLRGRAHLTDDLRASDRTLLYERAHWNPQRASNPFADMTVDQLCLRGVVANPVAPSARSLRVLALVNAVCAEVEALRGTEIARVVGRVGGGPVKGMKGAETLPVVATLPVEAPVITFFAYTSYLAPPLQSPEFAADGVDPGERCHPYLMPYMAGTRDTLEYAEVGAAASSPGEEEGALERAARAPDQFNMERWVAAGAARLGLYEYLLGGSLAVPRNYTTRLTNALVRGRRFPIVGFVAEAEPAFALEGPMLWETARLLWDPTDGRGARGAPASAPARVRQRYCRGAFGAGAEAMAAYLDVCEGAWAATRDRWQLLFPSLPPIAAPDRRDSPTVVSNYFGRGMAGRAGHLSQLDGWYQPSVRSPSQMALWHAWSLLNEARAATARDPGASARVERLREGFGLTLLIALWYQPLHEAFLQIRRSTDESLFQFVAELFTGTGAPGVAQYVTVEVTDPALRADDITHDRTDIVRTLNELRVPPVAMPRMVEPGRTLLDRIRTCIGNERESGIRALRLRVHQYLAQRNALLAPPHFTTDQAAELREARLGFGLYEGASAASLREGDGVWIPRVEPMGPARLAGLNLRAVTAYTDWWLNARTTRMGTDGPFVLRFADRADTIVRNVDAAGLGWMFTSIKQMAAVVLLYARDVATEDRDLQSRKLAIMNG